MKGGKQSKKTNKLDLRLKNKKNHQRLTYQIQMPPHLVRDKNTQRIKNKTGLCDGKSELNLTCLNAFLINGHHIFLWEAEKRDAK